MDNFYKKLNEECDVRFPYPNEQDWEWCAGDYIYTNDYIEFYKFYATVIDDWQKHLLINMIVQGIEDFMEQSEDEAYIDMLWSKVKEILVASDGEARRVPVGSILYIEKTKRGSRLTVEAGAAGGQEDAAEQRAAGGLVCAALRAGI